MMGSFKKSASSSCASSSDKRETFLRPDATLGHLRPQDTAGCANPRLPDLLVDIGVLVGAEIEERPIIADFAKTVSHLPRVERLDRNERGPTDQVPVLHRSAEILERHGREDVPGLGVIPETTQNLHDHAGLKHAVHIFFTHVHLP